MYMQTMKYILFVFLVIAFMACGHDENNSAAKDPAPGDPAPKSQYILGEVAEGQLGATADLPGVLKPFYWVDIYPKVDGFVQYIPVDRGSQVRTGQLLVRLEAPEIEQQYQAAKSKYLQVYAMYLASKDDYNRLQIANKVPGTVSARDLEQAQEKMMADSASAQGEIANYKALEATKDYLTVTAPFDGMIT